MVAPSGTIRQLLGVDHLGTRVGEGEAAGYTGEVVGTITHATLVWQGGFMAAPAGVPFMKLKR